jgi:hypothetical protein
MVSAELMCVVLAVFFISIVFSKTVNINVKGKNGVMVFSHDPWKNGEVDLSDLEARVHAFCLLELGDNESDVELCVAGITQRFTTIVEERIPFLHYDDTVVSQFSEDLIAQVCGSVAVDTDSEVARGEWESCAAHTGNAIRSVKVMRINVLAVQLFEAVKSQTLVPLEEFWHYGVEGNTMSYLGKLTANQNLVDDRRVVSVTETGFNMGHSVSCAPFYL